MTKIKVNIIAILMRREKSRFDPFYRTIIMVASPVYGTVETRVRSDELVKNHFLTGLASGSAFCTFIMYFY